MTDLSFISQKKETKPAKVQYPIIYYTIFTLP